MASPKNTTQTSAPQPDDEITISSLLSLPNEQRDDLWVQQLLHLAPDFLFEAPSDETIEGPDGFYYYPLAVPTLPDTPLKEGDALNFRGVTIRKLAESALLQSGAGIVLMNNDGNAAWIFTYGDIVNLHLHGSFTTFNQSFMTEELEKNLTDTSFLAAPPSEKILPAPVRTWLRVYLEIFYENPAITLVQWKNGAYDLALNATPDKFTDEKEYQAVLQRLQWFLPKSYTIISMDENTVTMEAL